jgi:leucyl aminopeptidase
MEIEVQRGDARDAQVDALIVGVPEGAGLPRALGSLDAALGGALRAYLDSGQFSGKSSELVQIPARGTRAGRVLLVGLGKERSVDAEALRGAASRAGRALRSAKLKSAAAVLAGLRRPAPEAMAQAWAEGVLGGQYRFDRYRTLETPGPPLERLQLLAGDARHLAALRRGARAGAIIGEASCLARDLSNEPGSVATPEYLAQRARALARETGLRATIFGERELERAGMQGILTVGRGSANPPRLIVLEHGAPAPAARRRAARGRARPTIALVGKGVAFDSGGISIKPAAGMDEMKHDMAGGAAVIAALRAVAQLALPLHVVGLVPAAQNLPDGKAYLPGDVIRSASGKTIEVLNTDAEGRILLADALHHARSFEPQAVIDLATLTGACVVALGHECAAVLGNDQRLIDRVIAAGERVGERAWQLPLWDAYKKQIKGTTGDLKNTGGRPAGTITAAAFLSHFTENLSWAHLDIAAVAWRAGGDAESGARGATGFGVRLLLDLLRAWKT